MIHELAEIIRRRLEASIYNLANGFECAKPYKTTKLKNRPLGKHQQGCQCKTRALEAFAQQFSAKAPRCCARPFLRGKCISALMFLAASHTALQCVGTAKLQMLSWIIKPAFWMLLRAGPDLKLLSETCVHEQEQKHTSIVRITTCIPLTVVMISLEKTGANSKQLSHCLGCISIRYSFRIGLRHGAA